MRFPGIRLSPLLALAALAPAAAGSAPKAAAPAQSGHVVARTRQMVGGKTVVTTAELWFTRTRSRLAVRSGNTAPVVQIYDGQAMYRWKEGDSLGQSWHPTGLRVFQDVVAPLVNMGKLTGRQRIGSGKVAGVPCTLYRATIKAAPDGSSWWNGTLNVRVWESQDMRFPFVLRTLATDTAGNGLESEITALGLNIAVADRLFRLPGNVSFLPPPEVRRGQRIAGAPKPVTTPVAISLADAVKGEKTTGNRKVVSVNGVQLALDAAPVANESDIDEVRLEPYNSGSLFTGQAVVIYLKRPASARLAHAAAAALGRYVVVQVDGEAVSAFRIGSPWAEENNRVLILDPPLERLKKLIQRFGGKNEKPAAGKVQL